MRACLLFLLATAACSSPPKPRPPIVVVDASAPSCASVCDHWRSLGCDESEDTPKGATCEDVCENVQNSGIINWNLGCRASVDSCDIIDSCER